MKKLILFLGLILSGQILSGQVLQLSYLKEKTTIPRVSWGFGDYNKVYKNLYFGVYFTNQGVIYKDSTDKIKYRNITISPDLLYNYKLISLGIGCDINIHEKEKIFPNCERKNKYINYSHWGSKYLFMPYFTIGISTNEYIERTFLYVEYYPIKMKNISMFNVGISYDLINKK